MNVLQLDTRLTKRSASFDARSRIIQSNSGSGKVAQSLQARINALAPESPTGRPVAQKAASAPMRSLGTLPRKTLQEQLYDALATFKVLTSTVAMHIDRDWRDRMFAQLDSLLDSEEWDDQDLPPTLASFATFLRMLLRIRPDRRPGLAASSDGHLIATWTSDRDRLTIECLNGDEVRWVLSRSLDGETERAAGLTVIARLPDVLAPYDPARWFSRAVSVHP